MYVEQGEGDGDIQGEGDGDILEGGGGMHIHTQWKLEFNYTKRCISNNINVCLVLTFALLKFS